MVIDSNVEKVSGRTRKMFFRMWGGYLNLWVLVRFTRQQRLSSPSPPRNPVKPVIP